MASGKNHDRGVIFQSPFIFVGTALITKDFSIAATITTANLFGGLFLSPDLDCPSRPYYRWSVFRFLWVPYMKLIPHHRHFTSHGSIVGSFLRLSYMGLLVGGCGMLFMRSRVLAPYIDIVLEPILTTNGARYGLAIFLGVELSAQNHYVLDNLYGLLPKKLYKRLQ